MIIKPAQSSKQGSIAQVLKWGKRGSGEFLNITNLQSVRGGLDCGALPR